jgi:hypothetical protein
MGFHEHVRSVSFFVVVAGKATSTTVLASLNVEAREELGLIREFKQTEKSLRAHVFSMNSAFRRKHIVAPDVSGTQIPT